MLASMGEGLPAYRANASLILDHALFADAQSSWAYEFKVLNGPLSQESRLSAGLKPFEESKARIRIKKGRSRMGRCEREKSAFGISAYRQFPISAQPQ